MYTIKHKTSKSLNGLICEETGNRNLTSSYFGPFILSSVTETVERASCLLSPNVHLLFPRITDSSKTKYTKIRKKIKTNKKKYENSRKNFQTFTAEYLKLCLFADCKSLFDPYKCPAGKHVLLNRYYTGECERLILNGCLLCTHLHPKLDHVDVLGCWKKHLQKAYLILFLFTHLL